MKRISIRNFIPIIPSTLIEDSLKILNIIIENSD